MSKIDSYLSKSPAPTEASIITSTDVATNKRALDVAVKESVGVTGTVSVAATGPVKITGESVTDTSASFPTAANQTNRVSFSIRNIDPIESIWIVNSTGITKAAAGVDIWEIGPNETENTELSDSNKIILVADAGKTVSIQIKEIAG